MVDLDFDYQQQRIYWIERGSNYSILGMHVSGRDIQVSVTMTMRMNDREGKPNEQ